MSRSDQPIVLLCCRSTMFTKTIVNRLWDRVFGAALVGRITDIKLKSRGVNPELTDYLISLMKELQYDQKAFMKILYKTDVYQRAASKNAELFNYYFHDLVLTNPN